MSNKFIKGEVFYTVKHNKVVEYEYLCEFPLRHKRLNTAYHVIIDRRILKPVRIEEKALLELITKSKKTKKEAELEIIKLLEEQLKDQKNKYL